LLLKLWLRSCHVTNILLATAAGKWTLTAFDTLVRLCCCSVQVMEAGDYISSKVDADAEFIMGAVHDETLGEEVCVTIVATGVSPRTDIPAAAGGAAGRAAAARQQQVLATNGNGNGNGNSRSSSPNPFLVPTAAAPAAAAPKAEAVEERPAGAKSAGGVQVPAFLRNMHRKK
jgi:hypothetical protein